MPSTHFSRRFFLLTALAASLGCRAEKRAHASSAKRIVSLSPNTTETVFALGCGDRLVGRSYYCDYPPEVTKLPSVGGYVDPSLEAILELRPDLIVGARGPSGSRLAKTLESRGIECFLPSTESVDEILSMIRGLGTRLRVKEKARELTASIQKELASIKVAVANQPRPRTLLVFGQAPIVVAGPNSFPDEMLVLAGCQNVVTQGVRYPTVGLETILGLNPDLIIDASMAGGRQYAPLSTDLPGWASVPAVKKGKVVRIDDDRIMRPGPRLAEGVNVLAHASHPGSNLK